jgi:hypothetical protein
VLYDDGELTYSVDEHVSIIIALYLYSHMIQRPRPLYAYNTGVVFILNYFYDDRIIPRIHLVVYVKGSQTNLTLKAVICSTL